MQEYSIHRSTRRCQKSDRPFQPGERYYSVVIQRGGELVRSDFARDQWSGPPDSALGWWVVQVPEKNPGKLTLAPASVLLDTLESLCESPNQAELAYLLALLLVRRRILTEQADVTDDETSIENQSMLQLTHAGTHREFMVPVCQPDPERTASLHEQLTQLLYSEA